MADETSDTEVTLLPDEEHAPEEGTKPSAWEAINNLAKDATLTERVRKWAYTQQQHFDQQEQRKKFCAEDGIMDMADRMTRAAQRRKTSSAEYHATLSQVSSTMYFNQLQTIAAAISAVYYPTGSDELPGLYEPEVKSNEFSEGQSVWIAEQANMVAQFTADEDDRRRKHKDAIYFGLKYGNLMLCKEWERKEEERTERIPKDFEGDKPTKFEFETKKRIVKDCPTLRIVDMKDMWFDAQLDDMELQRCIVERQQVSYEQLLREQSNGEIINVDKIKPVHLYTGEDDEAAVSDTRSENADMDATTDKTGLLERWQVTGFMPIREYAKRKGYGKWDAGKEVPTRYWATFIGKLSSQGAVCVRLEKYPYHHQRINYKLLHSHRDDNGAYHMGWATILEPAYQMAVTLIDMANDNTTLRNKMPYTVNGPIETEDLTASPNKVIVLGRNTVLTPLECPRTTEITMDMLNFHLNDADKTTGAKNAVQGVLAFARTAATEAKQNLDQAMQTIDEQAEYIAESLIKWDMELDALLWEQYADPDLERFITLGGKITRIHPERLWGPIKTKIVAVNRFRNNIIRRQELNAFMQNALPQFAGVMGEQGLRSFAKWAWQEFGIPHAEEVFPDSADYDAKQRARAVLNSIMIDGEWVEPMPNENHRAYLAVLEPFADEYALLPKEEQDQGRLRLLNQQIQVRKNLMAQRGSQIEGAPQEQGGMEAEGGLPGEIVSEGVEAQEGAIANA